MKIYKLDIDTSKPVNQVIQMQRNDTGLLSANVTNDGKYIRNLSCTLYDGDNEISATNGGFKVAVGNTTKVVKIEAKSTPIMSEWEGVLSSVPGNRLKSYSFNRLQLPAGTYKQEEFLPLLDKVSNNQYWYCNSVNNVRTSNCYYIAFYSRPVEDLTKIIPISFYKYEVVSGDARAVLMNPDEDIVVTEGNNFFITSSVKASSIEKSVEVYPAIGEYTDYQLDTTIRPSFNAPYDGEYTESLTEIEVDGVKFVPTTLSVDGVEYKVLAEAQLAPDPEEPVEPTEG